MHRSQTSATAHKSGTEALETARNTIFVTARKAVDLKLMTTTEREVIECLNNKLKRCSKTGCFQNTQEVEFISNLLGCHRSKVWRVLTSLEDKGWIINRTPTNGARTERFGRLLGIDLTPILERAPEIAELRSQNLERLVAIQELKLELKGIKGELRHMVSRHDDQCETITDFICSIPRRFGNLTYDVLRQLVETGREMKDRLRRTLSGRSEMRHQGSTIGEPTNTHIKEERICRSAGEKEIGTHVAPKPDAAKTEDFNVCLQDALNLINPGLRADIIQTYRDDPACIWGELFQLASWQWQNRGGAGLVLENLSHRLGRERATVLILLALIRDDQGEVISLPRYVMGCARKALQGSFMWGAGVRSAVAAQRRLCAAA